MLNKNIIYLKEKYNLSNRKIAELSGAPKKTIDRIVKGKDFKNITIDTVMKLAKYFDLSIDDLIYKDLKRA